VKTKILSPKERLERQREAAKRAALRALKRAKKDAETRGADLSDWEGEFLGSVEARVEKYGRAFHDPAKGGPAASLSARQGIKLREISRKVRRKKQASPPRAT